MRQKELRIALICYGGISLAVYMHGVTKELWHLSRASRAFLAGGDPPSGPGAGTAPVYHAMLRKVQDERGLRLRVLPDILAGASAGGINAVFLAQAVHSGQSLEPLTELWLACADVDRLLDPEAKPWSRVAKMWAQPLVQYLLTRPGNAVNESVAPETRGEVRDKLSRFVRSRWFEPPFSGIGFSHLLRNALDAMAAAPHEKPLLPPFHPLDLFVTATDFRGYRELLRLNSPQVVEESEHRMPIGFAARTPFDGGLPLADPLSLTFAARSTASFPGAFPPLTVAEIDGLAKERKEAWRERDAFLARVMPAHLRQGDADKVSLIDGSVLVNAPFAEAMAALPSRPAHREVDRRFVYIDPTPHRRLHGTDVEAKPVGFFSAIFGSISAIPREQPIRDDLERMAKQSREAERLQQMVLALRPDVERAVDKLFGRTLFLDRPTPKRLKGWRAKAQQAAAVESGFAYHGYAQAKFTGIVDRLAHAVYVAAPGLLLPDDRTIAQRLLAELRARGLTSLADPGGGANDAGIAFFRAHDVGFRIRRLRLLAGRLAREWDDEPGLTEDDRDRLRETLYEALALYFDRESPAALGPDFSSLAEKVFDDPGAVLDTIAAKRDLPEVDETVDAMLATAFEACPKPLRRRMLFGYLGFPYYDVATLPLLRNEGMTEFDPIKVDRISPEDASAIRAGGTNATLRGTEFYNFGAFFSRGYRENDYLWGRLHGAERMIDLVCSTLDEPLSPEETTELRRAAFLAILDEEEARLTFDPDLVPNLRAEVLAKLGNSPANSSP
jgi:patatin-related protein